MIRAILFGAALLIAAPAWADGPSYPPPIAATNGMGTNTTLATPTLTGTATATGNVVVRGAPILPDMSARGPYPNNNANADYPAASGPAGNAYWRFGKTMYRQTGTATNGEWSPQNVTLPTILAADAPSVAPAHAWGICLMTANYTANGARLVQITEFTGGAVKDVSYNAATRCVDMAVVGAFVQNSAWGVSKVYDQIGTADRVQATQASMPIISGSPGGQLYLGLNRYAASTTARTGVNLIETSSTYTKNAMTSAWTGRARSIGDNSSGIAVNMVAFGGNAGAHGLMVMSYYQLGVGVLGDGAIFSGQLSSAPTTTVVQSKASTRVASNDGFAAATASASASDTLTGSQIGMIASTTNPNWTNTAQDVDYIGDVAWTSAISDADAIAYRVAAAVQFGIVPQSRCNVVIEGESVWYALGQSSGQGIPQVTQSLLPTSVRVIDWAISGQTPASMVSNYPTSVARSYNAADACNIAILNAGLNGVAGGDTDVQTEGYIAAWLLLAQATGFTPFIVTEIDRGGLNGTQQVYRANINTWIRANGAALGYTVIDVAANPNLGTTGASANTAYFYADGIHPTNLGAAIEAQITAQTLLASSALASY